MLRQDSQSLPASSARNVPAPGPAWHYYMLMHATRATKAVQCWSKITPYVQAIGGTGDYQRLPGVAGRRNSLHVDISISPPFLLLPGSCRQRGSLTSAVVIGVRTHAQCGEADIARRAVGVGVDGRAAEREGPGRTGHAIGATIARKADWVQWRWCNGGVCEQQRCTVGVRLRHRCVRVCGPTKTKWCCGSAVALLGHRRFWHGRW